MTMVGRTEEFNLIAKNRAWDGSVETGYVLFKSSLQALKQSMSASEVVRQQNGAQLSLDLSSEPLRILFIFCPLDDRERTRKIQCDNMFLDCDHHILFEKNETDSQKARLSESRVRESTVTFDAVLKNTLRTGSPSNFSGIVFVALPDLVSPNKIRLLNDSEKLSAAYSREVSSHATLTLMGRKLQLVLESFPVKFLQILECLGPNNFQKVTMKRVRALCFGSDNGEVGPRLELENLRSLLSIPSERFEEENKPEREKSPGEQELHHASDRNLLPSIRLAHPEHKWSPPYEHSETIRDLEKSLLTEEEAIDLAPDGHPLKPLLLAFLGQSLVDRYRRLGDVEDLKKSISVSERALHLILDNHLIKALLLASLGNSFSALYERFRNLGYLKKAISMRERALLLTPQRHPTKPLLLARFGCSFSAQYELLGDPADLKRSILIREEALRLTPNDHPARHLQLAYLSCSLFIRYKAFGDVDDLENSISMRKQSLQLVPNGNPVKPLLLASLGNSLATRYERFGGIDDLEKSISMREHALQLTPGNDTTKPLLLTIVGLSLLVRYERFGDVTDLERSISLREQAIQFDPPDMTSRLGILESSLLSRYLNSADVVDLKKLISTREVEVELVPKGDPTRSSRLHHLSLLYFGLFQRTMDVSSPDLPKAILYSSQAARSHTSPVSDRFRASQHWIKCIRLRDANGFQSILDAYVIAVDLLPQLAWIGLSLHDCYHQLLQASGVVCDAAAAALDANLPELAVEWLEQGRFLMWNQLSQLRTPVDDLHIVYPELAAQFEHVSRQLEYANSTNARDEKPIDRLTDDRDRMGGSSRSFDVGSHHALCHERDVLLAEIRSLPGFERFLLPKKINQLYSFAQSGPVVFLNASRERCDALVVVGGSEHVTHVPLSSTTYDEVAGMRLQLTRMLNVHGRVMSRDHPNRAARLVGVTAEGVLNCVLSYLWDKVVGPIIGALGLSVCPSNQKLPRIFWCPTGPFAFVPIHAAGCYGNQGSKLSDFVISSYIPSMTALQPSFESERDPESTASSYVRLLAVRQPGTDGQLHLSGVPREMDIIKRLASSSPFVHFQETDGTVEDVMAKMARSDWVHFACHGTQDRIDPFDSGLLLANNKRLRLSDIVRLPRTRGGLAFLSACQTAMGDEHLSEEAIHLAAGMLLAGYKGVIATMWSIMDSDAPEVAEHVYRCLFWDGKAPESGQSAEALHRAIERLRASGASFLSWVPFIHVGL